MTKFRHEPTGKEIESTTPAQTARYRRSSRFTELTDSDTVSPIKNVMSSYPTKNDPSSLPDSSSSPAEASEATPDAPTSPPDSHETPTIAPETPALSFDDLTTTDVSNLTVSEVLEAVGTDPERAQQALDAETQGRNRVTLTSKLRRIR